MPREPGDTLVEITDPSQLPSFRDDYGRDTLLRAIDNSLDYFKKPAIKGKPNPYGFQMTGFSPSNLEDTLKSFREGIVRCTSEQDTNNFIISNFRVFQAIGKDYEGDVHFTGYGTPIYDGSVTPTGEFRYPVYKVPADFKKPYHTRREIEERNLLKDTKLRILGLSWMHT